MGFARTAQRDADHALAGADRIVRGRRPAARRSYSPRRGQSLTPRPPTLADCARPARSARTKRADPARPGPLHHVRPVRDRAPGLFGWAAGPGTAAMSRTGAGRAGGRGPGFARRPRPPGCVSAPGCCSRSVHLRHVDAGSDGSEEWEIIALLNPVYDIHRLGIFFTASPRHADILLVTGSGAHGMAEPLRQTYEAMPHPKVVIAVGTDAVGGGIVSPSYASSGGIGDIVPVDVWLPGSPPSPFAILSPCSSRWGGLPGAACRAPGSGRRAPMTGAGGALAAGLILLALAAAVDLLLGARRSWLAPRPLLHSARLRRHVCWQAPARPRWPATASRSELARSSARSPSAAARRVRCSLPPAAWPQTDSPGCSWLSRSAPQPRYRCVSSPGPGPDGPGGAGWAQVTRSRSVPSRS